MHYARLVNTLAKAGKQTHTIQLANGTRVLLLPYGGRVLGLFSARTDENFYWTHPSLESARSAKQFYLSDLWHNSGGDRTWLAPEIDLFFPNYPDLSMSGYRQPRQLDPGQYDLEQDREHIELVNRCELQFFRSKCRVDMEIRKWVQSSANPLRHEKELADAQIDFAGYEQHTSLKLLTPANVLVGLWNLIQMPFPGRMLFPTYSRSDAHIYFGSIPSQDLSILNHLVTWQMVAEGEHKIGLRAISTSGRVGYLFGSDTEAQLIVRNFFVDPSGEYVDVPWTAQEDYGYSVQACNVNSWLGQFNELEYHVPAIGGESGRTFCEDISQVWAYRGPRLIVEHIAMRLLGDIDYSAH